MSRQPGAVPPPHPAGGVASGAGPNQGAGAPPGYLGNQQQAAMMKQMMVMEQEKRVQLHMMEQQKQQLMREQRQQQQQQQQLLAEQLQQQQQQQQQHLPRQMVQGQRNPYPQVNQYQGNILYTPTPRSTSTIIHPYPQVNQYHYTPLPPGQPVPR
ncbi:mastermind-like protein 3 [Coregonus clupeaformis]|uniref:mastermind-like protein 3 n=1 Tax=Coregonus clupeaformis TaxID=59861 RepID=UPI001E1C597A|nr:mastermind-like protein 3 [Coregonus clupeaformis]